MGARRLAAGIAAVLLAATLEAGAATYWVSPTGTAGASGADSSANAKSLAWFNANAAPGDICRFKNGTYSDGIDPRVGGTQTNRIFYYGNQTAPGAVVVDYVRLGGRANDGMTSTGGDYISVKWLSCDTMYGMEMFLTGSWRFPAYDTLLRVIAADGKLQMDTRGTVVDSCTITGTAGPSGTHHWIDLGSLSIATGNANAPDSCQITNSTFNATVNNSGDTHLIYTSWQATSGELGPSENTFRGNTFNVTVTNTGGWFFIIEHYGGTRNLFQNDTWNISMGAGTNCRGITHRDSASWNRYIGCTFNITGSGNYSNEWTGSGSYGASTHHNVMRDCLWNSAVPRYGTYAFVEGQNGMRSDTLSHNVFNMSLSGEVLGPGFTSSGVVISHNTIRAASSPIMATSATVTGSRLAQNIFYSTAANSAGNELVRLGASGWDVDSAGVFFALGGDSTVAIDRGGTDDPPSDLGHSRWGTPRFADSTYATFDPALGPASLALGSVFPDGFAGAVGEVSATPLSITTTTLADRVVGEYFESSIVAAGGTLPYSWEVVGGNINSSSLDYNVASFATYGVIVGTGYATENISIVARVTDAAGDTVSKAFDFDIAAATSAGIAGYTFIKKPTQYSIGLRSVVSGDNDSSAVARIFYRPYGVGAAYDSGMVMVRRKGSTIHAARMIGLQPATTYEFYVEHTDEDGGLTTPADTCSTLPVPNINATGNVYYVSMTGSDGNSGLTPALAKRTIGSALAALSGAGAAGYGGGVVLISPGEWHENVVFNFADGTGQNPKGYFLTGSDPALRDSTIIDGSHHAIANNGYVNATTTLSWTLAAGVDSIYRAFVPSGDSAGAVYLGYGERLHKKTSITELNMNAMGVIPGWFWQNDTLYVKRGDGSSPTGQILHLGYLRNLLWVQKKGIRVSNLTLRFGGGGGQGYGIRVGAGGSFPANRFSADSLRLYGFSQMGVMGTGGTDTASVRNCVYDGNGLGSWPYQAAKSRDEEPAGLAAVGGGQWTIYNNTVRGPANGITSNAGGAADSVIGSDVEIVGNTLTDVSDDAIELDVSCMIGSLVYGNTIVRAGAGISLTPIYKGPLYILRNAIHNPRGFIAAGFKIGTAGSAGAGYALIAHNTVNQGSGTGYPTYWSGTSSQKQLRNNIFRGGGTSRYVHYNPSSSAADTVDIYTNDFNFNLTDSLSTSSRMARWRSTTDYSPASWQANALSFNNEKNGAFGVATFADTAAANLALVAGSLARDLGQRIPGVNSMGPNFGGPYYSDAAPDAGAFEYVPAVVSRGGLFFLWDDEGPF